MYIIKNALKSIGRSKGRNVLIGIIALVIAVSACIGLSIRQASENAREKALSGMSVTGTISYDRGAMMENIGKDMAPPEQGGGFDKDRFSDMMSSASSLSLEEYQKYSQASTVDDFYYTLTSYFDGSEKLSPVSDETSDEGNENSEGFSAPGMPGGSGGSMGGRMFSTGDFTVIGYSSDSSMTEFVNGSATILDGGTMFEEGTEDLTCVISEELSIYNNLSVGDTIIITNPSLESETYSLKISGIYTSTETNDTEMSMFGPGQDPANRIYMSSAALQKILDKSDAGSKTVTDENTGNEKDSAVTGTISATYVFEDTDAYYSFEEEVRTLGLDESYAVSSTDIQAFENSLAPLNTLSKMAGWFLLVILIIGGIILVVLNICNVRERKYEVGVLTAMGMKKWKVATQFICEILVVTMIAVIIGAGIGAVSSVPITNALLEGQVESQNSQQTQMDNNFGRPGNMGGMSEGNTPPDMPGFGGGKGNAFENMFGGAVEYVTEVDSAMNLTVVLQMLGIGILLTLIASAASVMFIMRYDPLKILANRD